MKTGMTILLGIYGAMSAVSFLTMGYDKLQARKNGWRVPEKNLHLLEILGGFPGSLAAQQLFCHKTRKMSYQILFWGIIVLHVLGWTFWMIKKP